MPYIESHQELSAHPKTKRAARFLGVGIPATLGHLHMLWHWCLDYAQDGDLTQHDPADIADAVMWEGDPNALIDALVNCRVGNGIGFLERTEDGLLLVHDWHVLNRPQREGRLGWFEWETLRAAVFKRDGYTCQYCGAVGVPLECDHIHPVSKGGTNRMDNLTTACLPCNRSKGDKLIEEWKR